MKNNLNPKLWYNGNLKPEIKEKLLEIAQHFYSYLKIDIPILDIILTGSLANYNWHSTSDIDLHIIIDFNKVGCSTLKLATELLKAKKDIYNINRSIRIKGLEVEVYAQDVNEKHSSNGQYSILEDKWLIKPKANNKPVDNNGVLKLSKIYKELIDDVTKLEDDELKVDLATSIQRKLIKNRKQGLESEGEYSAHNLVFKKLRKDEFYKLFNAISDATDKKLSLEQRIPK